MPLVRRTLAFLLLVGSLLSSAMPCGPGYVTPVFEATDLPEAPYTDFAAGRLGIVSPNYRRSILVAAYRHIAGNGLTSPEQQALIDVWKSEIDRRDFRDEGIDEAVKAWIDARKKVVGEEKKSPIYTERSYGGYDFFPNCTRNAFETATETLSARTVSYGATDQNVKSWLEAQDQVFENCAKGKRIPEPPPIGAPEWLQKDRAYQIAAAEFYSLNYEGAKKRFVEIADDSESPWHETANYLVGRTLIRQASAAAGPAIANPLYEEAEIHLDRLTSVSGKFSESAERLLGLVKYRLRPRERVSELAKNLTIYSGRTDFRQDVVDYTWLLDKFETETLTAEEKRKEAEKPQSPASNVSPTSSATNSANFNTASERRDPDDLEIYIYSPSASKSWRIYVPANASDDDALIEAEKVVGEALTDEQKTQIREGRQRAYQSRFTDKTRSHYEDGYWGDEKLTPSLLPDHLRRDEITEWLYAFPMSGAEVYLNSLKRYIETGSDLWLMTAFSQADKNSTQLPRLFEAFERVNRSGAGYPTMAYHAARILLAQGKQADARKLIDEMLALGDNLPLSARNSFVTLRLKLAQTMEEFIRYSLKKPFAFDFSGNIGTLDEIIAEQKTYYDPEYDKDGREAYDADVEARYKEERLWQERPMFDSTTIDVLNQHLSTASLLQFYRSPALPDYLRPRFALAIWMRAYLLDDQKALAKIAPELSTQMPEFAEQMRRIVEAKTPAGKEAATLYFIAQNPILSPFLEDGIGKTDNELEEWGSNEWWCEPYDSEYSDETASEVPRKLPPRPAYLTEAQSRTAQAERKRLKTIGDAPKFLGRKVLAWARRSSASDKRVPEALYNMIVANGWTKYGCGNNEELRQELVRTLKAKFPDSEFTKRVLEDEAERS